MNSDIDTAVEYVVLILQYQSGFTAAEEIPKRILETEINLLKLFREDGLHIPCDVSDDTVQLRFGFFDIVPLLAQELIARTYTFIFLNRAQIRCAQSAHLMPQVCDLAALRRFHDRLAEELTAERFGKLKFTPPVPGNADIVPLTGYDMLLEEGRLQHNCAASYCEDVASGRSFLYRVLAPERCTLELALRKGKWEAVQLLAACNRPPREETKIAVAKWLKEFQKNNEPQK